MFDSDKYELTEYAKDKFKYKRLCEKINDAWKKGIIYKRDIKALQRVRHKLMCHIYPTYRTLQLIGEY